MKKKMMAVVAGVLAFCMLGTGCQIHQSFGNLVPEEYGEWDNYYIYHGNVRSKTTGEGSEYLVTEVKVNEETYTVQSCADSATFEDSIYMCLDLSREGENGVEFKNGLVRYNVSTQTQEILMLDCTRQGEEGAVYVYHPYSIERIYEEDGLLLYGQRETITLDENGAEQISYQSVYFTVGYDGAFQEELFLDGDGYGYTRVSDEYFTKTTTNEENGEVTISYLTFGMEEGAPICTFDNDTVYVEREFVDKNGVKGFLLKTYGLEDGQPVETYQGDKLKKVEFFNLATSEIVSIWEGDAYVEWLTIPQNEYFITYENESVTYKVKDGFFAKATEQTAVLKTKCFVNQIVYSKDYIGLSIVYIFGRDMGLQRAVGVDMAAKQLYISMERYENAGLFKKGGYKSQPYTLDLTEGTTNEIKQDEWNNAGLICRGEQARVSGVACGPDYAYYIEQIKLTTINNKTSYAYRLQRYNHNDKTTEVMQLWKGTGSDEQEKYSETMWRNNGGDLGDFIVRPF